MGRDIRIGIRYGKGMEFWLGPAFGRAAIHQPRWFYYRLMGRCLQWFYQRKARVRRGAEPRLIVYEVMREYKASDVPQDLLPEELRDEVKEASNDQT